MPQSMGCRPEPAQQQPVGREVEELDAAVRMHRNRVVLPAHAGRDGEFAGQLELVADVDAVLRAPERGRLLVVAVVLVDQRVLQRGVPRSWAARAGSRRNQLYRFGAAAPVALSAVAPPVKVKLGAVIS